MRVFIFALVLVGVASLSLPLDRYDAQTTLVTPPSSSSTTPPSSFVVAVDPVVDSNAAPSTEAAPSTPDTAPSTPEASSSTPKAQVSSEQSSTQSDQPPSNPEVVVGGAVGEGAVSGEVVASGEVVTVTAEGVAPAKEQKTESKPSFTDTVTISEENNVVDSSGTIVNHDDGNMSPSGVVEMVSAKEKHFPVDMVYTWVNGSDPDWVKARREAKPDQDSERTAADANQAFRFTDHHEMLFSLRSVEKNAPWVNHIFILTAGRQKPSWLVENNRVTVVHHEEVFPTGSVLPNFNSFAIESTTVRIPQLSEHFLMMNDDMLFGHPVKVGDFYDSSGKPRIGFETTWPTMYKDAPPGDADAYLWAGHSVDYALDRNYGSETRHHILHQAYPMTKTLFNRAEEVYQKEFQSTMSHRFRNKADIMPHFLAAWVGIYEHKAVKLSEADTPSHKFVQMTDDISKNSYGLEGVLMEAPKLLCVGDMTQDTNNQKTVHDQYQKYLNSLFPDKSQFEKPDFNMA